MNKINITIVESAEAIIQLKYPILKKRAQIKNVIIEIILPNRFLKTSG